MQKKAKKDKNDVKKLAHLENTFTSQTSSDWK